MYENIQMTPINDPFNSNKAVLATDKNSYSLWRTDTWLPRL